MLEYGENKLENIQMKNYTLILLLAAGMMIACRNSSTQNNIETSADVEEVFTSDTIGPIVQSDNVKQRRSPAAAICS